MFPEPKETFPECLRNQNLFLRQFVSGTDGVNCPVTNSLAIFKHLVRRGLLRWDFIANTGNLHHETVWCNKIDSGINYRVLLRLSCEYLVFFMGSFTAVLLFHYVPNMLVLYICGHTPIAWNRTRSLLGRNKASKA